MCKALWALVRKGAFDMWFIILFKTEGRPTKTCGAESEGREVAGFQMEKRNKTKERKSWEHVEEELDTMPEGGEAGLQMEPAKEREKGGGWPSNGTGQGKRKGGRLAFKWNRPRKGKRGEAGLSTSGGGAQSQREERPAITGVSWNTSPGPEALAVLRVRPVPQ